MSAILEIPALIDMHVHFREPGFEYKETIETGAKAAFRGGFRTVCAMPNTNPVQDSVEVVSGVIKKAQNTGVRVLPVAAVTKNLDSKELVDFKSLKNAGAIAFSNDGLPILDEAVFERALLSGELIISHAESETEEVEWQIDVLKSVSRKTEARLHFAHISKAASLELIRKGKALNLPVTCETAPHYFTFTRNDVTDNGVFKMNPPLGDEGDKDAVIESVKDGTIDVIATDHAPHGRDEKLRPYNEAPNGITGLETALSLTLKAFDIETAVKKMAENPAKILRIDNSQTVKVDLDKVWTVKGEDFSSKCKITPYEGMELKGIVI